MKYYDELGFLEYEEDEHSKHRPLWTRKKYAGDLIRDSRRLINNTNGISDDITVNNIISVICDPYAASHFTMLRYASLHGQKWKIESVEVAYPRLTLTLGGLYNEPMEPGQ